MAFVKLGKKEQTLNKVYTERAEKLIVRLTNFMVCLNSFLFTLIKGVQI